MDLLDPKILDRISNYAILSRNVVEGYITGLHRSMFHGFGNEFVQYRNYAPGDDLKYLDWKVYARTNQLCSKVFREETNMNCRIVLDCSASMSFKGKESLLSKIEYASIAAASLSYLACRQGDKVGFYAYSDKIQTAIPPAGSQRHLHEIFAKLKNLETTGTGEHKECLTKISDGFKGRGLVIFISDMLEGETEILQFMKAMRFSNNDCILLQVLDNDEIEFPYSKNVRFVGMESGDELVTAPELVKENYQQNLQNYIDDLKQQTSANLIDYKLINTDHSLEKVLAAYLHKREEMR